MNKIESLYESYKTYRTVTTDTRKILPNSIFFALKGGNFNGNKFAKEALEKGAVLAVIDEEEYQIEGSTFLVDNVLIALQELAKYHRNQLQIPVIGLTGSNGKTTTKELMNAVLSQKFNTCYTKGNLNNHIGVPLTLLSIQPEHELAIIEMGANHQKEIAFLSTLCQPDIGYITNFGKAHLEGFGGVEGVIKGKSELYDYLRNANKTVLLNTNDTIQIEKSKDIRAITFGNNVSTSFQISDNQNNYVSVKYKDVKIDTNLTGDYNFSNICAAITLGLYFGIEISKVKAGIEAYFPDNNRSQIIHKKEFTLVLDCYNANPSSMEVALKNFSQFKGTKTVILGDMFELGDTSLAEHQTMIDLAEELNFNEVIGVGEWFGKCTSKQEKTSLFKQKKDLENYLDNQFRNSENILVKGSRGMQLETLKLVQN